MSGSTAPIRWPRPLIDPNFLGEADDLETMVGGYKITKRLLETPAMRALQKQDMFTEDVRTDDDIRKILRERVDTVYHPVGTCKMGVNDPMAVVDPKLKVHGVEGLRVVDASIMPTLIGGNTNAPTIMIGEKAADMIKAEMRGTDVIAGEHRVGKGALAPCPPSLTDTIANGGHAALCPPYGTRDPDDFSDRKPDSLTNLRHGKRAWEFLHEQFRYCRLSRIDHCHRHRFQDRVVAQRGHHPRLSRRDAARGVGDVDGRAAAREQRRLRRCHRAGCCSSESS